MTNITHHINISAHLKMERNMTTLDTLLTKLRATEKRQLEQLNNTRAQIAELLGITKKDK